MVALAHVPQNAAWAPNAGPQTAFLASPYREVGYGGSAGGGKSESLLIAAVLDIDYPEHNAILLRRSYPELRNLIRRSLDIYPAIGGTYNRAQHEWRFPSGAALIFRFIGSSEDVHAYQGDAFSFVGWDELTQFPADTEDASGEPINYAYQYMFSRLRKPARSKIRLKVRATFNPGGIGHHFVRTRFRINDAGDPTAFKDPLTGYHRAFIPARIKDNPHLAGSEYERQLETLPEMLRRALRDGRWDIFAGAMFSEWNPRCGEPGAHIVEPFHIPSHWQRWRGADDGFAAPAACVWIAKDPDTGQLVVYQELYRKGMTAGVFADEVKRMDREQPVRRDDDPDPQDGLDGVLDSAAFANNGQSEVSRGDVMNRAGCRWKPAEKGPGSRVLGVKAFHQRLAPMPNDPLKRPGIVFFKTCKNCCRTIPALPVDTNNPEDIDTDAEDHCFVAGTMVQTPYGEVSIESLRAGDLVETRFGSFPVLAVRSRVAPVIERRGLIGTPDHTIWTCNGWKRLQTLTPFDTVCEWQTAKRLRSMGLSSAATLIRPGEKFGAILALADLTSSEASGACTSKFTKLNTGRFRMDTSSTMLTAIRSTTIPRTLSPSLSLSTSGITFRQCYPSSSETSSPRRMQRGSGMVPRLAGRGTANTRNESPNLSSLGAMFASSAARGLIAENRAVFGSVVRHVAQSTAETAASTTLRKYARFVAPAFGPTSTAETKRADGTVLGFSEASEKTVFNLTIGGPPEFFANGILVHNCFDAVRYGMGYRSSGVRRVQISGF